jgi:hypothetical protein
MSVSMSLQELQIQPHESAISHESKSSITAIQSGELEPKPITRNSQSLEQLRNSGSEATASSEEFPPKSLTNLSGKKPHKKAQSPIKPINNKVVLNLMKAEISSGDKRSILKKPFVQQTHFRKDRFGTRIIHGQKDHEISFKKKMAEVIQVESFKKYLREDWNESARCTCNVF